MRDAWKNKTRLGLRTAAVICVILFCATISCSSIKSPAAAEQPAGDVASPAEPDVPLSQICKQKNIPYPLKSPHFVVNKSAKKISLFDGDTLLKMYPVAFGPAPEGPKEKGGDGRTPEGEYYLIKHSSSGFGKCFYIAYPNKNDADRGLKNHRITQAQYNAIIKAVNSKTYPPNNTPLGGLILLHGTKDRSRDEVTATNWTAGCIAMENAHILELLAAIPDSARPAITIMPLKKNEGGR